MKFVRCQLHSIDETGRIRGAWIPQNQALVGNEVFVEFPGEEPSTWVVYWVDLDCVVSERLLPYVMKGD